MLPPLPIRHPDFGPGQLPFDPVHIEAIGRLRSPKPVTVKRLRFHGHHKFPRLIPPQQSSPFWVLEDNPHHAFAPDLATESETRGAVQFQGGADWERSRSPSHTFGHPTKRALGSQDWCSLETESFQPTAKPSLELAISWEKPGPKRTAEEWCQLFRDTGGNLQKR